jgi:bifunctional UDP-N-acetylglucosamine pyrophosphorylase / glucosamine-1-phosphate N-acetyltransferase
MSGRILAIVFASKREAEGRTGAFEPLPPLLGKSVLRLTLDTVSCLKPEKLLIVPRDLKGNILPAKELLKSRRGKNVLVLDSRRPLLSARSLRSLLHLHQKERNALTRIKADIHGREVDLGVYVFRMEDFAGALNDFGGRRKKPRSLSAIVQALDSGNKKTGVFVCPRPEEALAVETAREAAAAMRILRERKLGELEANGVLVLDPASTWIDLDVRIGRGTVLYPSVVIEGKSRLGKECRVYPFVHLINTRIGDRVKVLSSTMIEESTIEDDAQVGPFTHFRPKTVLRSKARVGNFVEMKNTVFGRGSKAGHLSYLGDSIVEEDVNIGAGTITCNYDGFKKSQTIIGRGAFIGSGTELIAPVKVGKNAYVGAGSTITEDVSPGALAVARSRQVEKPGWARKRMKK